jgi:alpha-L-rhamnosidase
MKTENLRCEFLTDPLGIDAIIPHLSWVVSGFGQQAAVQIQVASSPEKLRNGSADLWDSGHVEQSASAISYGGQPLSTRQSCHWRAQVWDEHGAKGDWSEPAVWEMALLSPSDWTARWIGRPEHDAGIPTCYSPLLRKSFRLPAPVVKARLYSTGLGLADFFLNGKPVGNYVLGAGLSNAAKRVYYATDDVTALLSEGDNALGAWLYSSSYNPNCLNVFHRFPVLIAQLEVTCADGSVHTIVSDGSWMTAPSPITPQNKHFTCDNGAQFYEAYKELDGWMQPDFDDRLWLPAVEVAPPPGALRARMHEPTRVIGLAESVKHEKRGAWAEHYEFAESMTARLRIKVQGRYRGRLRVTCHDRVLDRQAHPDWRNDWNQVDEYRLKSGETVRDQGFYPGIVHDLTTPFLYRGVQEVDIAKTYIEGNFQPEGIQIQSVTAEKIGDDLRRTGHFRCSNPLLNDIYDAIVRTQVALTKRGYLADCPTREDSPWLGGATTCQTLLGFNFDWASHFRKRLRDMADEQLPSGEIPPHAPLRSTFTEGNPSMTAMFAHYAWHTFVTYGDTAIVDEQLDGLDRWLAFMAGKFKDGIVQPFRGAHSPRPHEIYRYGDPCAHGDKRVWDQAEVGLYNSLEILLAARRIIALADRLERADIAAKWRSFVETTAAAINANHFNAEQGCYGLGTQGVQLYAILSGVATDERRAAVLDYLSRDILVTRQGKSGTGWHATNMFFELLAREDMVEEANVLLTCEEVPSLGAFIRAGCTTIPEDWHIPSASNIHSVFLGAGSWFYEGYAGIQADPAYPGFERFVIRPQIPATGLDWVEASYDSVRGAIRSAWRREGEDILFEVTVPANTLARIQLPVTRHEDVSFASRAEAEQARPAGVLADRAVFDLAPGNYRMRVSEARK